jgi:hypothetical protein
MQRRRRGRRGEERGRKGRCEGKVKRKKRKKKAQGAMSTDRLHPCNNPSVERVSEQVSLFQLFFLSTHRSIISHEETAFA